MESGSSFGRVLMEHRKKRGMSRSDLARLAGLSYPYISQLETGIRKPSRSTAAKLATVFGMHVLELEAAIPNSTADIPRAEAASLEILSKLEVPAAVRATIEDVRPQAIGRVSEPRDDRSDLIGQLVDLLEEFGPDERLDVLGEVQKLAMKRLLDQHPR